MNEYVQLISDGKLNFIILLDAENKGGELVQKTRQSTLKLQKRWKLLKKQNCVLANMGILQSCQNLIHDLSNSFQEEICASLTSKMELGAN